MAVAKTKLKKKLWFEILAPEMFGRQSIGEVYTYDPQKAIGRVITVNLMVLTNDPKRQNINVKLKIVDFKDGKLNTSIVSYIITPTSIRRIVRRGRDKIDDSFSCKTSDNKFLRIKPMLITKSNTKNSVISALINNTKKILKDYVSKNSCETLFNDLLSHKIQSNLKRDLKKITPLRTCEIRVMELEKGRRTEEVVETPKEVAKEKPVEKEQESKKEKAEEKKEGQEKTNEPKKQTAKEKGDKNKKKPKKEIEVDANAKTSN